MNSHNNDIIGIEREHSDEIVKEQVEMFCLASTHVDKEKDKEKVDTTASEISDETNPINQHERLCACGCVPVGMLSLFEMAELRRKYREKQKQNNQSG